MGIFGNINLTHKISRISSLILNFYFRCRIACKPYPRPEFSGVHLDRNLDTVRLYCPVNQPAKRSKLRFLSASVNFLCNKRNLYQIARFDLLTNPKTVRALHCTIFRADCSMIFMSAY